MNRISIGVALALFAAQAPGYNWEDYDVDDYEEPAGPIVSLELNPADGIYGLSAGEGTWLRGTPVFGDFFLATFHNEIEEALYGGIGLTLRLMPHTRFAPFVGAGGSYNPVLARDADDEFEIEEETEEEREAAKKGESYWGGHAESGFRLSGQNAFFEVLGRYTWSSSEIEDPDYWLVRVSYGLMTE